MASEPAPAPDEAPELTVAIKALNEEANIERAIRSALRAIEGRSGEVVVADSLSRDRTVELASRYPVTVVQLLDGSDRSCGAGAQLAYQHARGEFLYLLDGDMELDPEIVEQGVAALRADPGLAGVGGWIVEVNQDNLEFQRRAERHFQGDRPERVDRLQMGGLYRTAALREVGYLADPNLHSQEEFELGARLTSAGWRLERLPVPAIRHHG